MFTAVAKFGVAGVVLASVATSLYFVYGSPKTVAEEYDQDPYKENSYGKQFGRYFASATGNLMFWKNKFSQHELDKTSSKPKDKFGTVTESFSNTTETALNKVCDAAYKETNTSNLVDETTSDTDKAGKFVKRNIWKFCALGDIVTVEEDKVNTYDANSKIGGDATNNKIFVSAKDDKNKWFWNIREEEFRATEGVRSQSKLIGKDQTENLFNKLKDNEDQTVSNTCHSVYETDKSSNTDRKNKEDAELFCSIKLATSPAPPAS